MKKKAVSRRRSSKVAAKTSVKRKAVADSDDSKSARRHTAYREAKQKASEYLNDPEKLEDLLRKASSKASRKKSSGPIQAMWEDLMTLFRMVRSYAARKYTVIPVQSILLIVGSLIYFLSPLDLIADIIAPFGLLDDAALLGWTINQIRADIDAFRVWENEQREGTGSSDPA